MIIPRKWVAVTPHDTDALTHGTADGLYVSGAGAVTFRPDDAAADVAPVAVAGGYLWGRVSHVRSTGTAASGIFAIYN